jgi:hypothetical protein
MATCVRAVSQNAKTALILTYGREEVHTEFWWGDLLERDPLENLHVNDRIILK